MKWSDASVTNVRIFYTDDRNPCDIGHRLRFSSLKRLDDWLKSRPWVTIRKMLMEYDYSKCVEYDKRFKNTSLITPEARSLF